MSDEVHHSLEALVKSVIVEVADIDPDAIDSNTFLFPDLAGDIEFDPEAAGLSVADSVSLDSLDLLDIVVAVEGVFSVRFDLESAFEDGQVSPADLASPERIATFLQRNLEPDKLQTWIDKQAS